MPIYEYKCDECGKISEFLIRNSSVMKKQVCPFCKSTNLSRVLTAPNLIKESTEASGKTCCGRMERCESPPCSSGEPCCRG